jgi:hypothetical protein
MDLRGALDSAIMAGQDDIARISTFTFDDGPNAFRPSIPCMLNDTSGLGTSRIEDDSTELQDNPGKPRAPFLSTELNREESRLKT